MITLITGLPGAGKTLYALDLVQREYADRVVVHNGIPGLTLPWPAIDGQRWHEVEAGTVVVLDEAQKDMRPVLRVDSHIAELETHRHRGIDLVVITQHPKLVHGNVRRLTGRHLHVVRMFGAQVATVHEWPECNPDPDKSRTGAITKRFAYPAQLFGTYKSAELHTHKRRIPGRVYALALLPVVAVAAVVSAGVWIHGRTQVDPVATTVPQPMMNRAGSVTQTDRGASSAGSPSTLGDVTASYVRQHVPAVPGLAYTAPVYAEVTRPVRAPAPVACVASSARCHCYTEDATRLGDMPEDVCRRIVVAGAWLPFREHWPASSSHAAQAGSERPEQLAAAATPPHEQRRDLGRATAVQTDGMGFTLRAPPRTESPAVSPPGPPSGQPGGGAESAGTLLRR